MRNLLITVAVALMAASFTGCASLGARTAPRKPWNVVFILVDDMGWRDLTCMGSDLYETPNIDRLASQGMGFTNAYAACTVCSPTRAAVMTGKYPARLHITDWIPGHKRPKAKLAVPDWTMYLPIEQVTIAEALKAHTPQYATCHIGKWHLGGEPYWPDKQGFDFNIGGDQRGQPPSYFSPYRIPTLTDGPDGEYLTDRETDEACKFIEANKDQPFFLYLPHYCVHTPLQAKQEMVEKYKAKVEPGMRHRNATYAAMIQSLDESVGRVMDKLDELGIADRTVVIFTSDNGGLTLRNVTNNAPLRAGKGSSYEGGVRVPLIVRWPGVVKPDTVCHEPVISVDYYPTILDMIGATGDANHNATVDGKSIVPLLLNPKAKLDRDALYWHYPHYHPGGATPYGAVRMGDWKLIEFYEDMHVELYNLKDDIGEKTDLSEQLPERTGILLRRLHAWRVWTDSQMPTPNPNAAAASAAAPGTSAAATGAETIPSGRALPGAGVGR